MFSDYSLYLVTGEETSQGKSTIEVVKAALAGGIDIVQMREKDLSKDELLVLGKKIAELCRDNSVFFMVNDDPYIAKEVGANGVHLGQEDLGKFPIKKTREILGKKSIIGISTHSFEQFERANDSDIDYIAYGPIFPTKTKDYFIGTERIKDIMKVASKPVVFIGGINRDNLSKVLCAGGKNVAVIRAITQAKDIAGSVRSFKESIDTYRGEV